MRYQLSNLTLSANQGEILPTSSDGFPASAYLADLKNYVMREVPWHWHKDVEALVIISGSAHIYLGKDAVDLKEEEGIFFNSNVLHRITIGESENCIFHSIVVDPKIIGGAQDSIFHQKYVYPFLKNDNLPYLLFHAEVPWEKTCIECIRRAHDACAAEPWGYELMIRSEFSRLWLEMMHHNSDILNARSQPLSQDALRVRKAMDYISKHYQEEIVLKDLANIMNVCPRECQRSFKKILHTTPTAYILKYRMELSLNLLRSTNLSIAQISGSVGFNSPSYYSKMFQKQFALSPNQYRKQEA